MPWRRYAVQVIAILCGSNRDEELINKMVLTQRSSCILPGYRFDSTKQNYRLIKTYAFERRM